MGTFDLDSGGGPGFPRVSPASLTDPGAPLDPGPGNLLDLSGNAYYQPTDALRVTLDYLKNRLVRDDTRLVAFNDDIYSVRATYQFTRFVAAVSGQGAVPLRVVAEPGDRLLRWVQ